MVVKPLANLNTSSSYDVFGPTRAGSRFDGIHLRCWYGSKIFTNNIIDAMRSTGMTRNWDIPPRPPGPRELVNSFTCPLLICSHR